MRLPNVFVGVIVAVSSASAAGGAFAAPTGTPTPPPKPGPTQPQPPSFHPTNPPPTHWYKFNGNVKDSVLQGVDLKAYTGDTGPKWEAGKDGTNPGAIRGYGWIEGKNGFIYPSFTVEFTIWPQAWNGKSDGNCQSADVFLNAYGAPNGILGPMSGFGGSSISVTGCGDKYSDKGAVDVNWGAMDSAGKPVTGIQLHAPLRSNMWHTVTVVFDATEHKVTLDVDGTTAATAPAPNKFYVGDLLKNRVYVGLASQQGWIPGLVDDVKFYGSAVYPGPLPMPSVSPNAGLQQGAVH